MKGLEEFRDELTEEKPFEADPFDFRWHKMTLAVDQTVASTGWVVLSANNQSCRMTVLGSGVIKTEASSTGHAGTIARATEIAMKLRRLMVFYYPIALAYELPPVATGKMHRPESSLAAAAAVNTIWAEYHHRLPGGFRPVRAIGAQAVKKRFTGNAKASKQELHRGLKASVPALLASMKYNNEHTRDALGIGLMAMEAGFPNVV